MKKSFSFFRFLFILYFLCYWYHQSWFSFSICFLLNSWHILECFGLLVPYFLAFLLLLIRYNNWVNFCFSRRMLMVFTLSMITTLIINLNLRCYISRTISFNFFLPFFVFLLLFYFFFLEFIFIHWLFEIWYNSKHFEWSLNENR